MFVTPELPAPGPHVLEAYDPVVEDQYLDIVNLKPASLPEAHNAVAQARALSDRLHGMADVSGGLLGRVDHQADEGLGFYRRSPERLAELDEVAHGSRPGEVEEEDWRDNFSAEDKREIAQDAKREIRLDRDVARYQKVDKVSDIVKVDALGRGHEPKPSGRLLSYEVMDQIDAHQEQVREGIGLRARAADAISRAVLPSPEPYKIVGIEQPVDLRQPFGGLDPELRQHYLALRYAKALQSAVNPVPMDGAAPRPVERLLDGPLQEYLNGHDTDDGLPADRAKRARIIQDMAAYLGRSLPKK